MRVFWFRLVLVGLLGCGMFAADRAAAEETFRLRYEADYVKVVVTGDDRWLVLLYEWSTESVVKPDMASRTMTQTAGVLYDRHQARVLLTSEEATWFRHWATANAIAPLLAQNFPPVPQSYKNPGWRELEVQGEGLALKKKWEGNNTPAPEALTRALLALCQMSFEVVQRTAKQQAITAQ